MGLVVRVFGCDACGRNFDLMQERDEPPPTECPFCAKTEVQGPIPSTTAIGRRTKSKAVDSMYRQHEEASAYRAELAGDPSIKQTDLKDNFYGGGTREGDVVATVPQVSNVVSDYMQANGMDPWKAAGASPQAIVAAAKTGPGADGTGGSVLKNIADRNFGGHKTPPVGPTSVGGTWGR